MTLYTVNPVTLTNTGSNYISNPIVTTAIGSLRTNTGQLEIWDGKNWTVFTAEYESKYIKHHIESAEREVKAYVNSHAANNVTINDALAEWLAAGERFKVIATLAENSL